jgi:hypothetical protein
MRSGYSVAWIGWAGDVAVGPHKMSITLPVARKADGTPISGDVVAELIPRTSDDTQFRLPYPASSTMPTNGKLTLRQRQTDAKITIADWSWADEREIVVRTPVRPNGSTNSSTRRRIRKSWASAIALPAISSRF